MQLAETNFTTEIAQQLHEHNHHDGAEGPRQRRIEMIEILEAVLLAVVAVVTAFSGYEAAKWDGESAKAYSNASTLRVRSNELQLTANQTLVYDADIFTAWLQAYEAGDRHLQQILVRRFTPEFKKAFYAWLAIHPFTNPRAPAEPSSMPEYEQKLVTLAQSAADKSDRAFEEAVIDRNRGEHFVRITVILAAVLFLVAIGQRFTFRGVRYGLAAVSGVLLVYCLAVILTYPKA